MGRKPARTGDNASHAQVPRVALDEEEVRRDLLPKLVNQQVQLLLPEEGLKAAAAAPGLPPLLHQPPEESLVQPRLLQHEDLGHHLSQLLLSILRVKPLSLWGDAEGLVHRRPDDAALVGRATDSLVQVRRPVGLQRGAQPHAHEEKWLLALLVLRRQRDRPHGHDEADGVRRQPAQRLPGHVAQTLLPPQHDADPRGARVDEGRRPASWRALG
mmetsp:Transcript_70494/g.200090  ORF Transcript_70494/g.200090 Transcript_70494/m.200090 type:complete len:214 (-) Transcript_70494:414-1055(-)